MATSEKKLKICPKGHRFYKSSDCPVCPICEANKNTNSIWHDLGAPARRALENNGIDSIKKLAKLTEKEVLAFHGMGPSSLPKLKAILKANKLTFFSKSTGPYIQYHKDGSVWAKGQMLNGVAEGFWQWYRKDGSKLRSGNFEKGKQSGEWTTYDTKGKKYKVTTIKN